MTDGTGPPLMQRAPNAFIWRRTTVDSHSSGYPLRHGTPHGMILPRWTRTRILSRDGTCGSSLTGGARETNTQYSRPTRSRSTTKRTQRSTSRRPPPRIRVSWRALALSPHAVVGAIAQVRAGAAHMRIRVERCAAVQLASARTPAPALRECIETTGRSFGWETSETSPANFRRGNFRNVPANFPRGNFLTRE